MQVLNLIWGYDLHMNMWFGPTCRMASSKGRLAGEAETPSSLRLLLLEALCLQLLRWEESAQVTNHLRNF